jgi:hypothetical protein
VVFFSILYFYFNFLIFLDLIQRHGSVGQSVKVRFDQPEFSFPDKDKAGTGEPSIIHMVGSVFGDREYLIIIKGGFVTQVL